MALGQWRTASHRWNAWTTFTALVLVVSNFCLPVSSAATPTTPQLLPREIANGIELRVLPIGDSITWGAQSSDDNGYRKMLYDSLVDRGNFVKFVGSMNTGSADFSNKRHEGHRGEVIDTIQDMSSVGILAGANIVLLHAGTNDMKNIGDPQNASGRLEELVDTILEYSPDAVVFVCQIIPAGSGRYAPTARLVPEFNKAVGEMVKKYDDTDNKVILVNMNEAVSTNDLADGLHPNDHGYSLMAKKFLDSIDDADSKGLISKPIEPVKPPGGVLPGLPSNCLPSPSWYRVGEIAKGPQAATSDGDFKPAWSTKRVVADGACPRAQLHFMDLDGDGLKDYACVNPKNGETNVHLNIPDADGKTSGKWDDIGKIANPKNDLHGYGVMFADLNGDGRDDYIYIDPDNGDISGWINRLEGDNGVWQWESLGKIAGGVGATNTTVQMVDVDGDDRDDLCIVNKDTGEVKAWLNTGPSVKPSYYDIGIIATGASAADGDTVILGDVTGNGKTDYMIVGDGGKVNALISREQEKSLVPRWLSSFTLAEGPDGAKHDQVRLVDMTGDGKVDFLLVDEKTGKVTLWENKGKGGKYQKGDGVFLTDLDGDGTSDYFWIDHTGKGHGYLNTGKGKDEWNDLGIIATGDHPRDQIRMGVLTETGRADYIVVDEKTGQANWWQNMGEEGGWGWNSRGECAAGPVQTVKDKFGWTFRGKNVRFADLNGDGYDDYVYVEEGGATAWWENRKTDPITWGPVTLVADGPGVPAKTVQFGDTNGDGKLDYVVVGSTAGRTRTWINKGFKTDGSGAINWAVPISFADGVGSQGSAIRIAEMTGDKRFDYVSVNPENGALSLWHNRCSGGDPSVPPLPPGTPENPDDPDDPENPDNPNVPENPEDPDDDPDNPNVPDLPDLPEDPFPTFPEMPDDPPEDAPLRFDSTCDDVEDYTRDEGGSHTPSYAYVLTDAHSILNRYLASDFDEDSGDSLVSQFAAHWGVFNVDCRLSEDCQGLIFDCEEFDLGTCDEEDEEADKCDNYYDDYRGSGAGSVILRSFYNLHRYLAAIDQAMETTAIYYSIVAPIYIERYYPPQKIDALAVELLWLFGTILALPAAIPGISLVAGGISAVYGVAGSAMARKLGGQTTTIEDASDMAETAYNFIKDSRDVIQEMHDALLQNGTYETEIQSVTEFFRYGAMVDQSNIPVISTNEEFGISETELAEFYSNWLHAKIINWSWRKRGVYIMSYKMSEEDWERAKDWPEDLRVYYKGHGYFLCHTGMGTPGPTINHRPSGWDKIKEKAEGTGKDEGQTKAGLVSNFDVQDVLYSSVDNWDDYGANADQDRMVNDMLDDAGSTTTPRNGAFNIPVCYVHESWGIDTFYEQLPWHDSTANMWTARNAGWCLCAFVEDKNGERFWEVWNDDLGDDWVYECTVSDGGDYYPEFGPEK